MDKWKPNRTENHVNENDLCVLTAGVVAVFANMPRQKSHFALLDVLLHRNLDPMCDILQCFSRLFHFSHALYLDDDN